MKKMELELPGIQELSAEETAVIIGGESLWYWVGYAIGYAGHIIGTITGTQTTGQKAMSTGLG